MICVCAIFRKSRSFRYSALDIHPSQAHAEAFTKAKDKAAEMALETAKQEGMAFPSLSEWHTGNWKKHLAGLGKNHVLWIEVKCDEFCNFYSKRGIGKHMFH